MAGPKTTYQIDLNEGQYEFLQSVKEQYNIPDESKAVRIVVDYLLSNPQLHETVFSETRCLRCE